MGVTAAAALIVLVIAYIAQSPRLLNRLRLSGSRLDLRARTFTGYALALLLLAFGFFIAGVPLGSEPPAVEVAAATPVPDTNESGAMVAPMTSTPEAAAQVTETPVPSEDGGQPVTGAFAGPPPAAQTATAAVLATTEGESTEDIAATATPTEEPSPTPTATPTNTPSPTATATPTPLPTVTPTPIFEDTAEINTGTSTLWLKRTPGGRDIALLNGGEIVILRPGHANVGGILWREVITVDGTAGWVMESFLTEIAEGA